MQENGLAEMRQDAKAKLEKAAKNYEQNPNAETLKEVHGQALRMAAADPSKASETLALLKELLPVSTQPPAPASPTKS